MDYTRIGYYCKHIGYYGIQGIRYGGMILGGIWAIGRSIGPDPNPGHVIMACGGIAAAALLLTSKNVKKALRIQNNPKTLDAHIHNDPETDPKTLDGKLR